MNPLDNAVFFALNGLAGRSVFLDRLGVFFAQDSPFLIAAGFLLLWFLLPRSAWRERRALVYATLAGVVGLVVSALIGAVYYRARPFVAEPTLVHRLIAHAADSSFPSDHATLAGAVFFGLYPIRALRWPAFVLLVLVMWARVFVGVHWPTDVLAGAALGGLAAAAVWRLRALVEAPVVWFIQLFGFESGAYGRAGARLRLPRARGR